MILEEYSEFPKYVLRFLPEEQFICLKNNGILSLKELKEYCYKNSAGGDSSRLNETEGGTERRIIKEGIDVGQHDFPLEIDVYMLCACLFNVNIEDMKGRFNTRYYVKIKDVKLLLKSIDNALLKEKGYRKERFESICQRVIYNKIDSYSKPAKVSGEYYELFQEIIFQKPEYYQSECEFRFAFRRLDLDKELDFKNHIKIKIDNFENIFEFHED